MALVGSPSTASSAPTEPSSTRTTSSATGGSTLTAPPLRSSTPSTTRLPQRGTPLQVTDWEPTEGNQSTELLQNTQEMLLFMRGRHLAGEEGAGGSVEAGGMEGGRHRAGGGAKEDKISAAVMLQLCVIGRISEILNVGDGECLLYESCCA